MKVGDTVRHRIYGLCILLSKDITCYDGDWLVYTPKHHGKKTRVRKSWLEAL